ncbi:MAG: hypothetical protein LBM77_09985 [Spirochaetaceae bacterium]|jgi:UDP-3-O-[3-hydroxymyristoyl] glucosamine N-acyltransferase|nr:hypothetical protein [Spirochaetaceae bacterium]
MKISISEICDYLNLLGVSCRYTGNSGFIVEGYCDFAETETNCMTWIKNINSIGFDSLQLSDSVLYLVDYIESKETGCENINVIECENPKEAFFELLKHFFIKSQIIKIENDSIIETHNIGKDVSIGHRCFICEGTVIGNNVSIHHNVIIETSAIIGDDSIIWSGVVIGGDSLNFYKNKMNMDVKVPQLKNVIIGKNVEVGTNSCIDRGCLVDTVIGDNVKIGNLCYIAHNSRIGNNVFVGANSMILGGAVISDNAYIAPGSIIMNHKKVGDSATVGLGSVVMKDVQDKNTVLGIPAKIIKMMSS